MKPFKASKLQIHRSILFNHSSFSQIFKRNCSTPSLNSITTSNPSFNLWYAHEKSKESWRRPINLSFYRFVSFQVSWRKYFILLIFFLFFKGSDLQALRNNLLLIWGELNIYGRIYIGEEGINSQMTIPQQSWNAFLQSLQRIAQLKGIEKELNISPNSERYAFSELSIRIREQIVTMKKSENVQPDIVPKLSGKEDLEIIFFQKFLMKQKQLKNGMTK